MTVSVSALMWSTPHLLPLLPIKPSAGKQREEVEARMRKAIPCLGVKRERSPAGAERGWVGLTRSGRRAAGWGASEGLVRALGGVELRDVGGFAQVVGGVKPGCRDSQVRGESAGGMSHAIAAAEAGCEESEGGRIAGGCVLCR